MCHVWGREVDTGFWWGNLREGEHWEDPDINGRIMLRWIFRNKMGALAGFIWLRIGTESGHL
jgi:hypothetical protein